MWLIHQMQAYDRPPHECDRKKTTKKDEKKNVNKTTKAPKINKRLDIKRTSDSFGQARH